MENKTVIHILAISGILVLFIAFSFEYKCMFKSIFNIPCITCGLTRGFIYIINLELIKATKLNLLSIPLFLLLTIFYLLYLISIVLKKDYILKFYNYFIKYYKLFIVTLILCWIINIFKERI